MFKANMLLAKMAERGISRADLASALGINNATLFRKFNGTADFKRSEIEIIKNYLGLSIQDAGDIFFAS